MKTLFQIPMAILVAIWLVLAPGLVSESGLVAEDWWKINGEPQIKNFHGGQFLDEDAEANEELKAFLQQTEFKEWTTYEDELVKLRFPKHPLLKFEKKKQGADVRVEGGVVTTVDNRFKNAYYLTAGEATYGVFLVQDADWLDDGVCFCGPMVHHVYNMEHGCLVRFSLLPGGAVKKAQVLGDRIRLMAFEWTHLACPRTIYESMVESMELKVPTKLGSDEVRTEVQQRYGLKGLAGLLQKGMPVEQAVRLMGEPDERTEQRLAWHGRQSDYRVQAVVRVQDGKIEQLVNESVRRISDDPIEGTLTWARVQITGPAQSFGAQPSVPQISEETKGKVAEICLESLAGDRAWEANELIQVLAEDHDFYSPAIAEFLASGERSFDNWELHTFDLYRKTHAISDDVANQYVAQMLDRLATIDPYEVEQPAMSWTSPVDNYQRAFLEAFRLQQVLSPEAARKTLARFAQDDQLGYRQPILQQWLHEFDDQQKFEILHSSIVLGSRRQNRPLLEAALEAIALRAWIDPAEKTALRGAIENMGPFSEDPDWESLRERALTSLRQ